MNFIDLCINRFQNIKSLLCLGLDPVIEKFPDQYKNLGIEKAITNYFCDIIENFKQFVYVIKPNIAFYEQYGIDGYKALKNIVNIAKKNGIPIIIDAKRGDIGNTSIAYAKSIFLDFQADGITLSPYLGEDSLLPFFEYKDKGFFILSRTSNKGSFDFQLQKLENGDYLYIYVAKKISEWNIKYSNGIGIVVGATHLNELKEIIKIYIDEKRIPFLIPGVGTQGGDFFSVLNIFRESNYPLYNLFINSSSKITYSFLENSDKKLFDVIENEIKKFLLLDKESL